jgi:dTDP-glucose 4,6-dehydratase
VQNILVTGAAGFIGSNFVRYLRKNYSTTYNICGIVDNLTYAGDRARVPENIPFIKKDIATLNWEYVLDFLNADILVNFAAQTHVDNSIKGIEEFEKSNILGVKNIVQGVSKYERKKVFVIFVSTDEVYGDLPLDSNKKLKETAPLHPNNPYSWTKAAGDLFVQMNNRTFGNLDYTIVRAANNYGPSQHFEKFLPTVISKAIKKESIPIYGNGKNIREWLWVEDFCAGITKVIDCYANKKENKVLGEVFNFGANSCMENIDLAKLVLKILNRDERLLQFIADRPGHDKKYALDWSKSKKVLGWEPKMQLESGVKLVISNIVTRLNKC